MSESKIPFSSHIEGRVLVAILEDLKLATKPFIGERIFLRELGYSVIVDSLDEFNKVEGYSIILEDDTNEIISGYFPLRVQYDIEPSDPFQVGDRIKLKIHNFRTFIQGDPVRVYKISVNGVDITKDGSLEIDLDETTILRIVVESKGLVSYIEREVKFLHPTCIFFSTNRSLRSVPSSAVVLSNEGALNITRKPFLNSVNQGYLYIVSGYRPEYVKTGDLVEFAIEGEVYYDDGNKVIWRSDLPLNKGSWVLTIR